MIATWFSKKWTITEKAYIASIEASLHSDHAVPQWFFIENKNQEIIAGAGVIENDFHKRPDLSPNICAIFVEPTYRNRGIAKTLLDFICEDLAKKVLKQSI